MKVRLQDVVRMCKSSDCRKCDYHIKGECVVKIDGYFPCEFAPYLYLCKSCNSLAKALYTNEEIELYEDSSKRTN